MGQINKHIIVIHTHTHTHNGAWHAPVCVAPRKAWMTRHPRSIRPGGDWVLVPGGRVAARVGATTYMHTQHTTKHHCSNLT